MKTLFILLVLSCVFTLASCRSLISAPPLTQKSPDVLTKPTTTFVQKKTQSEIPKGTSLTTDDTIKIEVTLKEDTVVTVKPVAVDGVDGVDSVDAPTTKPQEIILPKNTQVILPENTNIQTTQPTTVTLEAGSEVVLPQGTEISVTKINWYAVLFYCIVVVGIFWYYMKIKAPPEDQNKDGFVDDGVIVSKKKLGVKKR